MYAIKDEEKNPDRIEVLARMLISDSFLKARNIFSSFPLFIHGLQRSIRVQAALKCDIDTRPDLHFMRDNGYHSPRHYWAVAFMAMEIGCFNELSHEDMDLLVATALVHDYGYKFLTSGQAGATKFTPEASCLEEQHILFAKTNNVVEAHDVDAMIALNHATKWTRRHDDMSILERCLSDADVLQSCLSPENYAVETIMLERESAVTGMAISKTFLQDVGCMSSCVHGSIIHPLEHARRNTLRDMAGIR